jgi:hypothetical protein
MYRRQTKIGEDLVIWMKAVAPLARAPATDPPKSNSYGTSRTRRRRESTTRGSTARSTILGDKREAEPAPEKPKEIR